MEQYTHDWFSHNIPAWEQVLGHFKDQPKLKFLEVGCFEGKATNWLCENILTGDKSGIVVIDTFEGSPEEDGMAGIDFDTLRQRFESNTYKHKKKITILQGYSQDILRSIVPTNKGYDFIYIDATHTAYGTLQDAVLCHDLLKPNGIIIFDDYQWVDPNRPEPHNSPALAIESFVHCFKPFYDVVMTGYQVGIQKKANVNVV